MYRKCFFVLVAALYFGDSIGITQDRDAAALAYDEASVIIADELLNAGKLKTELTSNGGYSSTRIEVTYIGDDWGFIAAAMAIELASDQTCLADQNHRIRETGQTNGSLSEICPIQWYARLVRAPVPDGHDKPYLRARQRGSALRSKVAALLSATPEAQLETLKPELKLETLDVTAANCPTAELDFLKSETAEWVPHNFSFNLKPRGSSALPRIFLHPDTIKVKISSYPDSVEAQGVPVEGTPMRWGLNLLNSMTPCLEAAGYQPLGWAAPTVPDD